MSQDIWRVLYTHQKTQKQKKWKDGTLKYNPSSKKGILCDEAGKTVDSKFLSGTTIEAGGELEFDGNLIQVEELQSSSGLSDALSQPKNEPPKPNPPKATQPPTRRPGYRSKIAKRPVDVEVEEEEEEVPPPKIAKTAITKAKQIPKRPPTPPSDDELEDESEAIFSSTESQKSTLSVESVPETGRDSDEILAMLFGDSTPAPQKAASKTTSLPRTKLPPPADRETEPISDEEEQEDEPPPSPPKPAAKTLARSLASQTLPVPKRRKMGRSAILAKKAKEEEGEGEVEGEGEGEEDEEDVQLSVLKKRATTNPAKNAVAATKSSETPPKSSEIPSKNSATTKNIGKGFKVPVSQVERKKAALFQHDKLMFPDPELCEGLLKQGSAPKRQIIIPNLFTDLAHYTSTFTRALTEDINLQLVELSQKVYQNFADLYRKSNKSGSDDGPKCPHGAARLFVVKKEGKNKGKEFYSCAQKNKNCKFFKWADEVDGKTKQKNSLKQRVESYEIDKVHETGLHKAGVNIYIECELIAKKDETVDFFGRANKEREKSAEKSAEKSNEPEKPPILYLKLGEKREASSAFSKDDLWIISSDPKFSGNGLFFFAKSIFHGPARSGLLEIKPVEDCPKLPCTSVIYALHCCNISTELSMIDNLANLNFYTLPILPYLIWGRDPASNKNYKLIQPPPPAYVTSLNPKNQSAENKTENKNQAENKDQGAHQDARENADGQDPFKIAISEEDAESVAADVIETYKLNLDQERVLRSVMEWFQFESKPSACVDTSVDNSDVNSEKDSEDEMYNMGGSDEEGDAEFLEAFMGKDKKKTKKRNAGEKGMGVEIKIKSDGSPVVLVHGVFGSGKSYLIVILIIYLCRILNQAKNDQIRILVSAVTNVAVDRILLGLVAQGFTQFIRVGSLKKIAKPILPFTLHEARRNAKSEFDEERDALKDLNDMIHHDNLSGEELKYVQEMIAAIKGGSHKNKKKELKSIRVIGVTCVASSFSVMEGNCFPIVFLDECSQMLEPLSLLPIGRFGCSRLLAVGDPMQLPPTLRNSTENNSKIECGLEKTLFLRLVFLGFAPIMLRTQYRCHPTLSGIVNSLFYNNRLLDGITAAEREPLVEGLPVLMLCDSEHGKEKVDKGGSYMNEWEAQVVVKLVVKLLGNGIDGSQIGVICLYKAQLKKVQDLLRAALGHKQKTSAQDERQTPERGNNTAQKGKFVLEDTGFDPDDFYDDSWMEKQEKNEDDEDQGEEYMDVLDAEGRVMPKKSGSKGGTSKEKENQKAKEETQRDTEEDQQEKEEKEKEEKEKEEKEKEEKEQEQEVAVSRDEVQVSTVDAFQGAEKEIIILTCSRTDRLGFSDSPNRLNVAITRAKRHLFIVGQQKLMSTSDTWKHVIQQATKSPNGIQKAEAIVFTKDFAFIKR
eukprot:Phypoly_transcript_00631.p1 GENE.Phypoly_transcript_00631~~Phypoly_transcript_00631.p1  ORF type:complete len:1411 (+),score=357.55 Phypoly_transcript_00631:52-4284(+)